MSERVELSIVIVNFNTKELLKNCLESIFTSLKGSRLGFEIIVVDNASIDGSADSVGEFARKYSCAFVGGTESHHEHKEVRVPHIREDLHKPTIKLIENRTNLGFSKANNQAIQQAQGKYILLLNSDTVVPKKTLSFMVEFMQENKRVGIATCRVELPSGELDDACHRGFPTPWNAFCYFLGLSQVFPKSNFFNGYHLGYQDIDRVHEIAACVGAFLLIRRNAGKQVGWLDEDYFWYGEDLDLCFRIKRAGWKIMYVPDVKIIHYKGAASGIKKNSLSISKASRKTKILATKARFDVMRMFYNKHYRKRYPQLIRWIVLSAIEIKKMAALLRIRK